MRRSMKGSMKINRGTAIFMAVCCAAGVVAAKSPVYKDAGQSIEKRIEDLLGRMTLEEKVAQMDSQFFYSPTHEKDSDGLRTRDYNAGFAPISIGGGNIIDSGTQPLCTHYEENFEAILRLLR